MDDQLTPTWHRIRRATPETRDTITLELEADASGSTSAFLPGQFNMLYLPGVGEVAISLSGNPDESDSMVHTIRAYGTVTGRMQNLKRGDTLGVRGPYGVGWPMDLLQGNDILMCAGGIGLAPLRPALHAILAHRERYGKVTLLYGERTPQDLLFRRQIQRWRGRFDLDIRVTVDSARRDWRGDVGVVTQLISSLRFDPQVTYALLCGPEIMMRFAILALIAKGLDEERIILSMERNMKCGLGLCGHCQIGPLFVCRDGPVFRYDRVKALFYRREC